MSSCIDQSRDASLQVRHDVVDSLDVVACRQSLDVSVLKDRLAVKQKNRRQTSAFQRKINVASRHTQVDLLPFWHLRIYTIAVELGIPLKVDSLRKYIRPRQSPPTCTGRVTPPP